MLLALKIDVDTIAAIRDSVPNLMALLSSQNANATFFFNMGPDAIGNAKGAMFRTGESRVQQRANRKVEGPQGMARLYGQWIPAPLLPLHGAEVMRNVQQSGFEIGLRGWDSVAWIKNIEQADSAWIQQQWESAITAFEKLFEQPALAIAAPNWRSVRSAFRLEQRMEFIYGSDCRGTHPFLPVVEGEPVAVPQIPTTLPTLSDLVGAPGISQDEVVNLLLAETKSHPSHCHVFNINAQADGSRFRLPMLQKLFEGWIEQGYQLAALNQVVETFDHTGLPWHEIEQCSWRGYTGKLACQGFAYL